MSAEDNGGPAFPVTLPAGERYSGHSEFDGMTLRDYFAAKALCGILADPDAVVDPSSVARVSYNYADAMLEARKS